MKTNMRLRYLSEAVVLYLTSVICDCLKSLACHVSCIYCRKAVSYFDWVFI